MRRKDIKKMDIQTYLQNAAKAERQKKLAQSDQLTLGELILKLEPIVAKQKDRETIAEVVFDFEYLFPIKFSSWRGSYDELALTFTSRDDSNKEPHKVTEFLELCKQTIGKTFEGWKGGEFTMSKITPVWVANAGNSGNTALIDVVDNDYDVILITGYREY